MDSPKAIQLQVNNQSGVLVSVTVGGKPCAVANGSVVNFTASFKAQITAKVDADNNSISIDITKGDLKGEPPGENQIQLTLWVDPSYGGTFTKIIDDEKKADTGDIPPLDIVIQLRPASQYPVSIEETPMFIIQEVRSGDGD